MEELMGNIMAGIESKCLTLDLNLDVVYSFQPVHLIN